MNSKSLENKISRQFTILDFICSFKDYNDFAFEMIESDSPLTWIISSQNLYNMNLFEYSLDKNNIDLAMKLIEKWEISRVISTFPLNSKNLANLVGSDHIFKFLECIVNNKSKIRDLIIGSVESYQAIRDLKSNFKNIDKRMTDENIEEDEGEDCNEDPNDSLNVIYAYYLKHAIADKLDNQIEMFNILFYDNYVYTLDTLVKRLSVAQIKELNKMGYTIGKQIWFTDH